METKSNYGHDLSYILNLWNNLSFPRYFLGPVIAKRIKEVEIEYQDLCTPGGKCRIDFVIEEKMEQPIYIYYELDNFYQNHRRYVKSRDNKQLMGNIKSADDLYSCDPIRTVKDLGISTTIGGNNLPDDAPANPCGLIAKSFFQDSYEIYLGERNITINDKGIAWETDKQDLFKDNPDAANTQWLSVEDEHFIVWMRVAGFSDFKKPWGKIEEDLEPGKYSLVVKDKYDVSSFKGKKRFFMSTTNSYGGKNTFLAVWYLVVGSLWFVFAAIFLLAYLRQKKRSKSE